MYLLDSLRTLLTTLRQVTRTPTTVHYPAESRVRTERARVSFALVHDENGEEACVGCLLCEKICPSKIITVRASKKRISPKTGKKRAYADDFTLDLNACIFCELCVQVCPTDAIVMTQTHTPPGFSREALVLTMDRLYENEIHAKRSWSTGSGLMQMQDPKRQPPPAGVELEAARDEGGEAVAAAAEEARS
ncbi:MAG: 4Fe-4S binding protein [Myxococcales bacterium]|nr:4Fe-4S binding protein [Myxococcales bacterium]